MPNQHIPDLAGKIRSIRNLRNVHQKDVAQQADISVHILIDIEKGRVYPLQGQIVDIGRVLQCDFFDPEVLAAFEALAPKEVQEREEAYAA